MYCIYANPYISYTLNPRVFNLTRGRYLLVELNCKYALLNDSEQILLKFGFELGTSLCLYPNETYGEFALIL